MNGHPAAERYPLGRLFIEARLLEGQMNRQIATQALATQAAIGSCLGKEGQKSFKKLIERLMDG